MKIVTSNNNSNSENELEQELKWLAKDYLNTDKMINYTKGKSLASLESDTNSRVTDMMLSIKEIKKLNSIHGYRNFIVSMKSWTVDVFPEELLFDRENMEYNIFMYPFCEHEQLYRVSVNHKGQLIGKITLLDNNSYREGILKQSKTKDNSFSNLNINFLKELSQVKFRTV